VRVAVAAVLLVAVRHSLAVPVVVLVGTHAQL